MSILIIYAHPNKKGHCSNVLDELKKKLKKNRLSYNVIDLYKIKYDPIMHENEHYTSGSYDISKQNKKYQSMIKNTNKIIFIFPLWWMSMPAILKGFIDKVITPRFAFIYKNGRPKGLLNGKKAAVIVTTGGSKFIYMLMFNLPFNLIKYGILKFSGIKSKVFQIDNSTKLNEKQIFKIKKIVAKSIYYLK
jgi:NAD(P)H dehydrogenase (quinone)